MFDHHNLHVNHVVQVQVDDQSTLPSSYCSFVASGRYDAPDAPAEKKRVKLYFYWERPHPLPMTP